MVEKDVQKRILKVIKEIGGSAKVLQVMALTKMKYTSCHTGLKYLVSRGLVTKTVIYTQAKRRVPPHQNNTYHLKDEKMEKINRLISEIGRDD